MKVKKLSLVLFLVTFVSGCILALIWKVGNQTDTRKPANQLESASIAKTENTPYEKVNNPEPKVFNVDGVIDEDHETANNYLFIVGELPENEKDSKIKATDKWMGFYSKGENAQLLPTKVSIKKKVDKFSNGDRYDWTSLTAKTKEQPFFLIRNLKTLKAGKVKTLFRGLTWEKIETPETTEEDYYKNEQKLTLLKEGFVREFKLGEKNYILRVEEGVDNIKHDKILALFLESGGKKQLVHYIDYPKDEYYFNKAYVARLYWVGDLDSDGNLDLFMEFWNYGKGFEDIGLFLSSKAEKGKLVKLFGYFRAGC